MNRHRLSRAHVRKAVTLFALALSASLLLACVQHTAVHRKYGDPQECARRFGQAMGVASLQ